MPDEAASLHDSHFRYIPPFSSDLAPEGAAAAGADGICSRLYL